QDEAIRCYHVDARLSKSIDDIGRPRKGKILFLLKYCFGRSAAGCATAFGIFTTCPLPVSVYHSIATGL
ncbi:MAG TPA: hypothetical protein VKM56_00710, partial [Verrucomicrobiae bacterium]|nr:hypothetical protein [Verrucomicrobiae bacterium]